MFLLGLRVALLCVFILAGYIGLLIVLNFFPPLFFHCYFFPRDVMVPVIAATLGGEGGGISS